MQHFCICRNQVLEKHNYCTEFPSVYTITLFALYRTVPFAGRLLSWSSQCCRIDPFFAPERGIQTLYFKGCRHPPGQYLLLKCIIRSGCAAGKRGQLWSCLIPSGCSGLGGVGAERMCRAPQVLSLPTTTGLCLPRVRPP